jgi:predicted oxidoreductase (fatty acid repression mutant protein)
VSAISTRRSIYTLTNSSPIPSAAIRDTVHQALLHAPSSFNVQSARAVILLGSAHRRLWDLGAACLQAAVPPAAYEALVPRVRGFRAAHGTVLFFEDQAALDALRQKQAAIAAMVSDWSLHSSGMHQFIVWTALELQGLGAYSNHCSKNQKLTRKRRQSPAL